MLAKIGDFIFDINDTNYKTISQKEEYRFSTQKRLDSFDIFQDINKHGETLSISGELYAKSQSQLKAFEDMAREKKERTFVLTDGTVKTVIILSLEKTKESFLQDGAFLKQSYTIEMVVVL